MKNDFVSTTTDVVPEAIKAAGSAIVEEQTKKTDESKADESGEQAEIKAQDAVETDLETEADDKDVDAGDDDQEKTEEVKPKKKGGFQKKLERKDREIEQLREQLARQQQPQETKPVDKVVDTTQKPKIDDFDSQADYLEALTDWKVEQKVKEREQEAKKASIKTEYESRVSKFQSQIADFAKTTDDYADVIEDVSDVMITPGLQEAILESENGPEILYNLAKNRDELMRINKLSLVAQAKEIGKLEARLAKTEEKKPELKTKTAAPPPPKPVGTKSPGKVVKDPSEMSGDEYIAWKRSKK